jgi:hypothetical protein
MSTGGSAARLRDFFFGMFEKGVEGYTQDLSQKLRAKLRMIKNGTTNRLNMKNEENS